MQGEKYGAWIDLFFFKEKNLRSEGFVHKS